MYLKITKWILIIAAMVIVYYIGGIICLFLLFISHIVTPVANYFHNHTGNVPRFKFIFFDMLNFLEQNLVYFEKKRYIKFEIWLDSLLCQDMSSDIITYYFCLYEGENNTIAFQLIGSDKFDEDWGWGYSKIYHSKLCCIVRTSDIQNWEDVEKMSIALIDKYLQNGKYAYKLQEATAVGLSFCSACITILYGKESEKKRYDKFEIWLDSLMCQDMSSDIIAYYFCLYEGSYGCETITFHLIGSDEFDEIDEDWACNNLFDDNPLFYNIVRTPDIQDWRDAEKMSIAIIDKYLQNGKYAYKLKEVTAVGVGFDDGSITILHRKETLS